MLKFPSIVLLAVSAVLSSFAAADAATPKASARPAAVAAPLPAAVMSDPPRDNAFPTQNVSLRLPSHGSQMNAVFYLAAGDTPHPTVLLLHGLPGNEQNLDLAQTLRRAGFNVLTLHYRGAWGSDGAFTLANGEEDGQAALDFLREPLNLAIYHINPQALVVIGHSFGGDVAVRVTADNPQVRALVLIGPWDISDDLPGLTAVPAAALPAKAAQLFDDVDGRLGSVTSLDLARDMMRPGHDWHLASSAGAIANRPILVMTATHDDHDDMGIGLVAALNADHAPAVKTITIDTDHAFSDHRITLQSDIVTWLKGLGF